MGVGRDRDEVEHESGFDFCRNNSGASRISSSTWNMLPDYSYLLMNPTFTIIHLQTLIFIFMLSIYMKIWITSTENMFSEIYA
jgi:hypothetical protein